MKKSNFSESQRKAIIEKRSQGQSVEEICRAHQISPATFYKWKREIKDMANEDKRRLRELEKENARIRPANYRFFDLGSQLLGNS